MNGDLLQQLNARKKWNACRTLILLILYFFAYFSRILPLLDLLARSAL